MDIGSIAAWVQIAIWVFVAVGWVRKKGKAAMSSWVFSNRSMGLAIILGFVMAGVSLYFSYTVNAIPKEFVLNTSAYDPPYTAPMRVIADQTFEDTEVPLDGYIYQHCVFINVCFMYEGGAYGLQDSAVKKQWKICSRDKRLQNYRDLMDALKMFSPKTEHTRKTVVNR